MFPRYLTWIGLALALWMATGLRAAGPPPCAPVSATLTYGADDYFWFWLNGNLIVGPSGFDIGAPMGNISIPVGDFSAAGSANYFAAEIQNQNANLVGGTWMISITCADGSLSYITDGDGTFSMYDDITGGSPPPVEAALSWFQNGYPDTGGLFSATAVPANPSAFWFSPQTLTNPVTGLSVPILSHSNSGVDSSASERLYFRESITLPVITLTPTPTPWPTACGTPVFQGGAQVDSGCPGGGVTNVTVNNPGGPGQILLVELDSANTFSSITYGGVPLTLLTSNGTYSIYYQLAPVGGSNHLKIVQNGASWCSFYAGYTLYGYVDQSPPPVYGPFSSSTNSWTDTFVPSKAGSIAQDYVIVQNGGGITGSGTSAFNGSGGFGPWFDVSYGPSTGMPFSYNGSCCGHAITSMMVELIPPQGCVGTTPTDTPTVTPTFTPLPLGPTHTFTRTPTPPPPGSTLTDTPTVTLTPTDTRTPGPTNTPAPPAGPGFSIVAVVPNPVTGSGCNIVMSLPGPMTVNFKVYDLRGELIWSNTQALPGGPTVLKPWAATNNAGAAVSYGAYYLTANSGSSSDSKWLTVVR
jgi:hypothetical protein